MIKKPIKVLCKRTLVLGENHWWDDSVNPPIRHERDNRELVAGNWYDVIDNPNDSWDEEKRIFTFTILDNRKKPNLFRMYGEEDKKNWPDICIKYGPRDYAKWFYTPEELQLLEHGKTVKAEEDIFIKPGNYHWVKSSSGEWMIALCSSKHETHGKFYWLVIGSGPQRTCDDFEEIGEQVISREKQIEHKEMKTVKDALFNEICVLIDAINKNDPNKYYPSVEYVMPFVNKALDEYFHCSFKQLSKSRIFNKLDSNLEI